MLNTEKKERTVRNFNPSYIGRRDDVVNMVPDTASKILDIGCSTGVLGSRLKERGQHVECTGIEFDRAMAEIAKKKLDRVIVGNVETIDFSKHLGSGYYDCIIFADILEHLVNPWGVLKGITPFLGTGGMIIASIPNIEHYSTMLHLLIRGSWPYRERGIHDKTHLRFFTIRNIREMFESAGLEIHKIRRNYRIIERGHSLDKYIRFFAVPVVRKYVTFQYLICARKANIDFS